MQIQYLTRLLGAGALRGCGLGLVLMMSCFDPRLDNIGCAQGDECPPGLVCDGELRTCVAPEQVTAEEQRCGSGGECPGGPKCGDGTHDPGEQCDAGGQSATCDSNCTVAYCGDGERNTTAGEQCDDAGESMTCDWDCSLRACGDHTVNTAAGEQCDDGNTDAGDGCSAACMIERH